MEDEASLTLEFLSISVCKKYALLTENVLDLFLVQTRESSGICGLKGMAFMIEASKG